MEHITSKQTSSVFNLTVLVCSLGYFVDIYDLQLFNIVGKTSLADPSFGLDKAGIDKYFLTLFNYQMFGMLMGGIIWGILGDIKGRKSILFGSILLYSIANILNGFVHTTVQYEWVRFFAGLGLAGELGAAITLVAEIMTKENRGYGTMMIVTVGAFGAVMANLIAHEFPWHTSYFVGGGLGFILLVLRFATFESGMFAHIKHENVTRGNFISLFTHWERFKKYLFCIMIGIPVWFCIGVLIKFSETFAKTNHVTGTIFVGNAIMWSYTGLSVGDLLSGLLSQLFKSRKKIVTGYLISTMIISLAYLFIQNSSPSFFYFMCFLVGAATGYWALFVTIASEQFGTNIRATATTTVPNFVRGCVIPLTTGFSALSATQGVINSALIVGGISIILAFIAIISVKETFGKDLNYVEMS